MNPKIKQTALAVLIMFSAQEFVYAASISTRVRILENKVATNAKIVKQLRTAQDEKLQLVDNKLRSIKTLESKIDLLMKEREKSHTGEDKRYSYP